MINISGFIKTTIAAVILAASANTFAATECKLGDACSIPNTLDKVYFSFSPDEGSRFTCEVRATKGDDLQVDLTNGKDYVFQTQTVQADKDGRVLSASIPGHFKEGATRGEIIVHQTLLTHHAEGTVKCFASE